MSTSKELQEQYRALLLEEKRNEALILEAQFQEATGGRFETFLRESSDKIHPNVWVYVKLPSGNQMSIISSYELERMIEFASVMATPSDAQMQAMYEDEIDNQVNLGRPGK